MLVPLGNELNAAVPEREVELHRTCVRLLDKSISPMQSTFNCKVKDIRVAHEARANRKLSPKSWLTPLPDNGILRLVGFTGMFPRTEFNVPATRNSRIVKWGAESGPVI